MNEFFKNFKTFQDPAKQNQFFQTFSALERPSLIFKDFSSLPGLTTNPEKAPPLLVECLDQWVFGLSHCGTQTEDRSQDL